MILQYKRKNRNEDWTKLEMNLTTYYQILKEYGNEDNYIRNFIHEPVMVAVAFHQPENVSLRNKIAKQCGLGCDVELGGVGDTMKYGTILIVGGGLAYAMWRFNLFGGLKWLKEAFRDIVKAPETISIFEDNELNQRVNIIDKIINILKTKAGDFNSEYGSLNSEWQKLRGATINALGKESYKKTFYESAKMSYFGSKSTKEKIISVLDQFRTKALQALRTLQSQKNFKINSKWEVVGCLPCLF